MGLGLVSVVPIGPAPCILYDGDRCLAQVLRKVGGYLLEVIDKGVILLRLQQLLGVFWLDHNSLPPRGSGARKSPACRGARRPAGRATSAACRPRRRNKGRPRRRGARCPPLRRAGPLARGRARPYLPCPKRR